MSSHKAVRAQTSNSTHAIGKPPAKQAPKKRALPCGARTCLHCHRGCGVETAAYILRGLDNIEDDANTRMASE